MRSSQIAGFVGGIFVLLMMSPCFVPAVTHHGLSWGVDEGDRIDYTRRVYKIWSDNITIRDTRDYYVIVNELSPIPENVTNIMQLYLFSAFSLNLTVYYANGTLEPEIGLAHPIGYAIGNWSLIQDLYTLATQWIIGYEEWEWIDTDTEWGFTYNSTDAFDRTSHRTMIYSKTDGLLNELASEHYDENGTRLVDSYIVARKEDSLGYLPLLLIGGGFGVLVIVLLIKWRQ